MILCGESVKMSPFVLGTILEGINLVGLAFIFLKFLSIKIFTEILFLSRMLKPAASFFRRDCFIKYFIIK